MPKVTLTNNLGKQATSQGGCFGFAGRSNVNQLSTAILNDDTDKISLFSYHIGEQYDKASIEGLRDPRPYLNWLAESSPWAKYIEDVYLTVRKARGEDYNILTLNSMINIKTNIPGHCVIGAASAARLAVHRKDSFIPFWNAAVNAGADGMVTLLVYYAMFKSVVMDVSTCTKGITTSKVSKGTKGTPSSKVVPTGSLGLSDDEVMVLTNVTAGTIYSMIRGDFEMMRNDGAENLYETAGLYSQDILNSYLEEGATWNFGKWLNTRFATKLTSIDVQTFQTVGGMGRPKQEASSDAPVYLSSLIGWALTLTTEFKINDRFLGWREG